MFSFQVANGDLVLAGSQLGIVTGTDKLKQELMLWMLERFGIDRFHPAMGSDLQNYIGGIIGYSTRALVYNEVMRVLDNYQRVQGAAFKAAPQNFSLDELLWGINAVNVGVTYDTVSATINVTNAVQQPAAITVSQSTT
jgi:hypothetical protein